MNRASIKSLFDKFSVGLEQDDTWQVQAATVIRHKALERLAAGANIRFEPPTILRAERDEAVVLVVGHLGDRVEWSIGEALVNINYRVSGKQAAYVYAMAEKRAKDRVIIKLAGLHGLYSEDEADEFKSDKSKPDEDNRSSSAWMADDLISTLKAAKTISDLDAAKRDDAFMRVFRDLDQSDQARVIQSGKDRRAELAPAPLTVV